MLRPSFFFSRSREGVLLGPWMSEEKEGKGKEISQKEKRRRENLFISESIGFESRRAHSILRI